MGKYINVTHEEQQQMVELYNTTNYSYNKISKIIGRDHMTVDHHLSKLGYKPKEIGRHNRKYTVNHNFFKVIDTEAKSYFLGLLYADGYVHKNKNVVAISLSNYDNYILESFRDEVSPDTPIYEYIPKSINRSPYSKFYITSKIMKDDLINLGCVPTKSLILTFPSYDKVPEHLIHHFIRGYFDGDGGVYKTSFNFTSTYDFLERLREIIVDKLGFKENKLESKKNSTNTITRSLRYSGSNQCIIFREWLYKDATIFLHRKKELFDKIISLKPSKSI